MMHPNCLSNEGSTALHQGLIMHHIKPCGLLGEPRDGKIWRHLAITKHFVRGYWFAPDHQKTGPGLLEEKRLPLRRLYSYRIMSDYEAVSVDENNLADLLETVKQTIDIIDEKGGG